VDPDKRCQANLLGGWIRCIKKEGHCGPHAIDPDSGIDLRSAVKYTNIANKPYGPLAKVVVP